MPADYHTHTPLCRHATGTPEEFAAAALHAGISEYGISDHAPQTPEPFDDWRMLDRELPEYFEWIARAREFSAGKIAVRAGLEIDWLAGNEGWIGNLADRYEWDYLIGSVHYLGSWDFDNPAKIGLWSAGNVEEIWTRYWETYTAMAASGLFDIVAHSDLVKKFGHRPAGDLARFYEPAVAAIAASGAAIEINTAGLQKPCAEMYPAAGFLSLAASAAIPLVISSDAHAPEEIGRDFPAALKLAEAAGFRETVRFEKRRRTAEAFG